MEDDDVFHRGDLQSGIAQAIKEGKLVICFVRELDATGEGRIWEQEWLAGSFSALLTTKAVLLRIASGSQEASFLNAFCPITNIPLLAVIRNGQVLEKVERGITHEEFQDRISTACGLERMEPPTASQPATTAQLSQARQETAPSGSSTPEPTNVQTLLSERGQRLEAERQRREAAEKAERLERATARRKEAEGAEKASSSTGDKDKQQARDAWLYQQKQRKDEAKKERERILAQIEHDKQERRAARERQKEAQQSGGDGQFTSIPTPASKSRAAPSNASSCALQVRLFDGTSIRSRFDPDITLADGVRAWVKQASPEGGADIPYSFRQMLAPQPSRNIEVSEEHKSLRDLDLFPNATLMLVPVEGYSSAYEANSTYVGSALNAAYWCASTASSALGAAISYIPGMNRGHAGESPNASEPSASQSPRAATTNSNAESGKVRTLYDRKAEQERKGQGTTFYNGNNSAFEGGPHRGDGHESSSDQ